EEMPRIERRAGECASAAVAAPERWEPKAALWADLVTLLSLNHQPDDVELLRAHPGLAAIVQAARDEIASLDREAENASESATYRMSCRQGASAWRFLLKVLGESDG